jgi:2-polyprenyl-6-methoxyphenol hydroxylase-like FAD-dependent oxidoreductase
MANVKQVPFLVIGGGIGGLATALGVAETGREVHLLEKAKQFGEVGAGLQLGPNALAVLDRLGVLESVLAIAVLPKRLVLMDAINGKELASLDLGEEFRNRYGYPYIVMHRADLHQSLLEACQANPLINLYTKKEVIRVENEVDQVRVSCADGSVFVADAVVGADGVRSVTRKLVSDDQLVPSHYVAYRGTLPISEVKAHLDLDDVIMWIGPNLHLVQYPVRRGELFNQVAVFKSQKSLAGEEEWGTPEELDEAFGKCCDLVKTAVSYMNRDFRWPMYDRDPINNWTSGRVTLLGDAAHAMLQYLAQGGVQALEDVACLTNLLHTHGSDIETAFQEYQEDRIPRSASVQTNARRWGEIIHAEDPISVLLRNTLFERHDAKDFSYVDWIYSRRYNLVKAQS